MNAPDTRTQVERLLAEGFIDFWAGLVDGDDSALVREMSETREEASTYAAAIAPVVMGLLADTRPAETAQGNREALVDLRDRLTSAASKLDAAVDTYWEAGERTRARGKSEGVRLALSYADEALRTAPQPHADTVETVEWGVRFPSGAVEVMSEDDARRYSLNANGLRPDLPTLVVRKVVGPWEVVS